MGLLKFYGRATMLALSIFLTLPTNAGTHYVGSYVLEGNGQQIFINDCNKFRSQFTATVGANAYYNDQYYYGNHYMSAQGNDIYTDYEDLVFMTGHGAPYLWTTFDNHTNFSNTGNGWGDQYLKWIGFFTCSTIMTPNKDANAWSAYNNTAKGVHLMCGFNEESALADTPLASNWAAYMKQGHYVWYAWFRAINSARNYYGNANVAGWPGTGSVVLFTDQYNNVAKDPYYDRLSSYSAKPTANAAVNFLYQY